MIPAATDLQARCRELKLPIVIVTGADDKIADVGRQSQQLHKTMPQSRFIALPGLGHMVHHLAPDQVVKAVEQATQRPNGADPAAYGQPSCSIALCPDQQRTHILSQELHQAHTSPSTSLICVKNAYSHAETSFLISAFLISDLVHKL